MLTRPPLSRSAPWRPVFTWVQVAAQSVDLKMPWLLAPSHTVAASKGSTITALVSVIPDGATLSHVPALGRPVHVLALVMPPPAPPLPPTPASTPTPPAPPLPAAPALALPPPPPVAPPAPLAVLPAALVVPAPPATVRVPAF